MNLKIPFLNTRTDTDLLLVFLLTPVWWLTGLNAFIYLMISFWVFFKMLTGIVRSSEPLKIPIAVLWFFVFLLSYLVSILINVGIRPSERIFASLNNYTMLMMGFFMMMTLSNGDGRNFLKNFVKWGSLLCVFTAIVGVGILFLWLKGYKDLRMPTLIYNLFPSLIQYPFFTMLLMVTGTIPDSFSFEVPRLTIYSGVATSTGGLMLFLIPLMIARYRLKKKTGLIFWGLLIMALTVLVFTVARAAIVAIAGAFVIVTLLSKGKKTAFVFISFFSAMLASGYVYRWFEWILNVRRSSTLGRMNLYEEALRIVFEENPLLGVGVRMREGFTMMAIGSHSLYIEIIFVAGIIGLLLFLFFQFLVLKDWLAQRKLLKNDTEKILWKYLGMALIGMNIWLVTETIFGPPFTTYGYFLIVSGVLVFGRLIKKEGIAEPLI